MIEYVFTMSILWKGIIYEENSNIFCVIIALVLVFPVVTFASEINHGNSDLDGIEENEFEQLIMEIENLKTIYPESSDEMILEILFI